MGLMLRLINDLYSARDLKINKLVYLSWQSGEIIEYMPPELHLLPQ